MNFEDYLKDSAQRVDEELEKVLSDFLNQAKQTDSKLLPLALGFINATKGGKRIRGMLVRLGYEIATQDHLPGERLVSPGSHLEGVFQVAAAYEILHASVLVHDDIIDQSELRRGKPSLYKALGGDHYGISQAISLGDAGFFLAIKIIAESQFLGEEKNRALAWLSKTMIDTTIGEMLDLEKEADQLTVMKLKTARYSISGPLILGAILAGAGHLEGVFLNRLEMFGENLGIAYQIKDDILDNEPKLGSAQDCEKKVIEYSLDAKKIIPALTDDEGLCKLLEEMVEYLVNRTK